MSSVPAANSTQVFDQRKGYDHDRRHADKRQLKRGREKVLRAPCEYQKSTKTQGVKKRAFSVQELGKGEDGEHYRRPDNRHVGAYS